MRRFLVLLQLLLLTLPTFASVAGVRHAEDSLPACCRRAGAHHCMMPKARHDADAAGAAIVQEPRPCPFCPKAMPSSLHAAASLLPSASFFAEIASHPASCAQTQAKLRMARDRSRQKRGPPQRA